VRNVIIAFIVSLGFGCGLAFLFEWLDDSVHNSENVESVLGLPLLAAIPATPLSLGSRLLPKPRILQRKKRRQDHYDLSLFERPEYSESYLQLRTHLMLSTAGGPPQTILITSGEEGEGKTITALNLATSLAATNDNILLIDADLRCPRVNLIKGLDNNVGLTTLLTAQEIDDDALDAAIQRDPITNLNILTTGDRSVNPANLLSSNEMRELLEKLSDRYTHIIIDSPPVLYFADSAILATLVDSVIIVVRDNLSSRQSVLKAQRLLQKVGATVIGMVMNGVPRQWYDYKKYRYYDVPPEVSTENDYQALKLN
jgi:capsular exopolysaccharide synthesis family protein